MSVVTVEQVYSSIANHFDQTRVAFWNGVTLFLDSVPKYSIVYDIGCGNGKYSLYRPEDLCWVGTDMCQELLDLAKSKLQAMSKSKSIDVFRANGLSLPFKSSSCQAGISIAVIHHLKTPGDRVQFLRELLRVVEPGGKVLFTAWAKEQSIKKTWTSCGNGDYLIPWHDRTTGQVHQRFYHLFDKDEMMSLIDGVRADVVQDFTLTYEQDNWFCSLTKQK